MEKRRILCYGDSNTFGFIPGRGGRYDRHTRWPGMLQDLLGGSCQVIEEGLCGRTTVFEDVTEQGRCGLDRIESVVKQNLPLDLLIFMLGSNDCKVQFGASAEMIAEGMERVLEKAKSHVGAKNKVQALLIAPAAMTERVVQSGFGLEFDQCSVEVSKELAEEYRAVARRQSCSFLDGSLVTRVSETDGLHLDEEGHRKLAEAVGEWVSG